MNQFSVKPLKKTVKYAMRRISHWKNLLTDLSSKLLVCVYHRVINKPAFDPFGVVMSKKIFVRQLDELLKRYPIISLAEATAQSESGHLKSRCQVVLTFDDGYMDNYEVVFPILKKKGLPATFYVSTDYIGADKPLWEVEFVKGICRSPSLDKVLVEGSIIKKRRFETRLSFALRLFENMKGLKREALKNMLNMVRGQVENMKTHDYTNDLCMTWEEVSDMGRNGMEIGAHGVTHRSLARLMPEDAAQEIMESKRIVEGRADVRCESFAFPFGSAKDYNPSLISRAKEVGFTTCMLNIHGYNRPDPSFFALKRVIMDEFTDMNCLLG